MRGSKPTGNLSYLDGVLTLWRGDQNPLWIWIAIKTCIENDDPFPEDVIEYLSGVATRLLSDDASQGHDLRKPLRQILGFKRKGGGGGERHLLRVARDMVKDEKFAVRFVVNIFNGQKPSEARGGGLAA
jgi:hypothetical protein